MQVSGETQHDAAVAEQMSSVDGMTETVGPMRQGDLILRRVGECDPTLSHAATPPYGVCLVAGSHGEHRMVAAQYRAMDNRAPAGWIGISLPSGGAIVHTDVPSGRHPGRRLAPGVWECARQCELTLDGSVVLVKD
jgi:hypothetical protein